MTTFLTWLSGTRIGQRAALVTAVFAAFFLFLARIWCAGRKFQQSRHDRASLEALRERSKKDDEVSKLDERHTRDELARWVQPGSGEP